MNKRDKAKIEEFLSVDGYYIKSFSLAFNPFEYTIGYLNKFANDRFNSTCFNDNLKLLHLDILKNITDEQYYNYEEAELDPTKQISEMEQVRGFFIKTFCKNMKEQLEIRKAERTAEIKAQKEAEKEAKGSKK